MRGLRTAGVLLVVLPILTAGCTDGPGAAKGNCDGPDCPPANDGDEPPRGGGDLPLPNATIPVLQFVGCRVQVMLLELQEEKVRPFVPDAFEVLPAFGPGSAGVAAWFYVCERTLDEDTLFGAAKLLWVLVHVKPTNESWTDADHFSNYVLMAASDAPDLVTTLGNWSVPAQNASMDVTLTPDVAGSHAEHWSVEAGPASYTFDIPTVVANPQDRHQEVHLWRGHGPFYRDILVEDYEELGPLVAGTFMAEGSGPLASIMPAPVMPYVGPTQRNFALTIQFDSVWEVNDESTDGSLGDW